MGTRGEVMGEKLKKIREMGGRGAGQTTIVVFCDEQQEEEMVSSVCTARWVNVFRGF